jgi:hypothetical protein
VQGDPATADTLTVMTRRARIIERNTPGLCAAEGIARLLFFMNQQRAAPAPSIIRDGAGFDTDCDGPRPADVAESLKGETPSS